MNAKIQHDNFIEGYNYYFDKFLYRISCRENPFIPKEECELDFEDTSLWHNQGHNRSVTVTNKSYGAVTVKSPFGNLYTYNNISPKWCRAEPI